MILFEMISEHDIFLSVQIFSDCVILAQYWQRCYFVEKKEVFFANLKLYQCEKHFVIILVTQTACVSPFFSNNS